MLFFNYLDMISSFSPLSYVFGAFALYGVMLILQKLVLPKVN